MAEGVISLRLNKEVTGRMVSGCQRQEGPDHVDSFKHLDFILCVFGSH